MIVPAGAVVFYAVVVVDALLRADRFMPELGVGAAVGGVLLVVALWRRDHAALGWSLLLAGAVYVGALEVHGRGVDGTAPLVATALFLCAELARWSFELRTRIRGDERLAVRRAATLVALATGAAVVSAVAVGTSAIGAPRDLAWTALGAAAAACAAGMGVWLARRG